MIYSQVALILLGSFWAPWWWLAVVGLLYGWRFAASYSVFKIFSSSFFSGFIVWSIFAYYFDARSMGKVSFWLAELFHLPHSMIAYLVAGLLAGTVVASSSYVGIQLNFMRIKKVHSNQR
ncbi:MAG: hypothetical protein KDD40_03655 [Bdellovibrionales bacterium]|nr:hypothetical protein [Bdellovibrionales bacterium]